MVQLSSYVVGESLCEEVIQYDMCVVIKGV